MSNKHVSELTLVSSSVKHLPNWSSCFVTQEPKPCSWICMWSRGILWMWMYWFALDFSTSLAYRVAIDTHLVTSVRLYVTWKKGLAHHRKHVTRRMVPHHRSSLRSQDLQKSCSRRKLLPSDTVPLSSYISAMWDGGLFGLFELRVCPSSHLKLGVYFIPRELLLCKRRPRLGKWWWRKG